MARRWRPGRLSLGPFTSGLNTAKAATLLGPGEAVACVNVDITDGTLRGLYGAGTTVKTVAASSQHIHYEDGLDWVASASPRFHLYDTINGATGKRYSFYLDGGVAKYANGAVTGKWLGIAPPAAAPTEVTDGASGGAVAYRYTYITDRVASDYAPIESNPSPTLSSIANQSGCEIGVIASADAAVNGIRLYATQNGGTDGPLYLVGTYANTTATLSAIPAAVATSTALNWDLGGVDDNAMYINDHSPAPTPNTMSNAMHAVHGGVGSDYPASGILFFGVGSTLYWSVAGYPWYVPSGCFQLFDAYIEGIVSDQATTYILTKTGIIVVTGTYEEALVFTRSGAYTGTTWGHSAVMTPYGLVYQTQGGIALFDGNTSRIITKGILAASDLSKHYECVWNDDQLLMVSQSDSSGGYVIDFSTFPNLRITTHNIAARAITRADAFSTPGPYIATYAGGAVGRWEPSQRGNVAGASPLAWSWTTGKLDAGKPAAPKRFARVWVEATGTISITVTCGNNPNTTVGTPLVITGSSRVPANFIGDWLQLAISSSDGTGVVHGIDIEYEVMD